MIDGKAGLVSGLAHQSPESRAQERNLDPPGGFDRLLEDQPRHSSDAGRSAMRLGGYLDGHFMAPTDIAIELKQAFVVAGSLEVPPEFRLQQSAAGNSESGWQELVYLLMGIFASGKLDQRLTFGAAEEGSVAAAAPSRATPQSAVHARASQVPAGQPLVVTAHSANAAVAVLNGLSRSADAWLSETNASKVNYERLTAHVLPPRENVLVLSANGQKRIYVRNFFSPADVIDRLRDLSELSGGLLAGAWVHVNGHPEGSV